MVNVCLSSWDVNCHFIPHPLSEVKNGYSFTLCQPTGISTHRMLLFILKRSSSSSWQKFPLDYYCMWQLLEAELQQKQPSKEQLCKSKAMREMSQHVGEREKYHRKTLSIHFGKAPMLMFLNISKSSVTEIIPLLPHTGILWANGTVMLIIYIP